ncbi:MAG: hypothetical protein AAGG48_00510 [Planctomycetota bacterium]
MAYIEGWFGKNAQDEGPGGQQPFACVSSANGLVLVSRPRYDGLIAVGTSSIILRKDP